MKELEQAILRKMKPDMVSEKAPEKTPEKAKAEPVSKKGEK